MAGPEINNAMGGDKVYTNRSQRVANPWSSAESEYTNKGGKMKKYNYNFIIHLLLNKYGWTQEEIGAWTWKKTNAS
tara:strand:+ start:177 stop:404 length:228 start_codon:yes stop_codon:yes gene_type:complete